MKPKMELLLELLGIGNESDTQNPNMSPYELPDKGTEAQTERNGLFSYAGEIHSFTLGIGAGLAASRTGDTAIAGTVVAYAMGEQKGTGKAFREIKSEPWYAVGGVVLGYLMGHMMFADHHGPDALPILL